MKCLVKCIVLMDDVENGTQLILLEKSQNVEKACMS